MYMSCKKEGILSKFLYYPIDNTSSVTDEKDYSWQFKGERIEENKMIETKESKFQSTRTY